MKKINSLFIVFGFLIINGLSVLPFAAQTQTDIYSPAGGESFGQRVFALPNGNFVVIDPQYDAPGPITDAGAVRLYNGATLALINQMTGTTANDFVGIGVFVLTGGDYVVSSAAWNGNRGAVTKCSQTSGCPTIITTTNSLTGAAAGDFVGGAVTALPNGNYVVQSNNWDNGAITDVGAITFCNGATNSCANQQVSAANSLIGSTASDSVGDVFVLSNGNYVVRSLFWDNDAAVNAGAVTRCSGTAACVGTVSQMNSLVGSTTNDYVSNYGLTVLTNGGYVVNTAEWDNGATVDVGAVTLCAAGCTGLISAANSLIGSTANDQVGLLKTAALTNGNYVVGSPFWDNAGVVNAGAATFCSGTTGCTGAVSTGNSLFGSTANDEVSGFGGGGIAALTNGNYVVSSPNWDNVVTMFPNVGAVTWCGGMSGCTGAVSTGNSLVGSFVADNVGSNTTALTNGNYVVGSPQWNNLSPFVSDAGAATFCSGASGCVGTVSSGNSLIGSSNNDSIGNDSTVLSNGNYVVLAPMWNNGATADVGAATLCSGEAGCVGMISAANSLIGTSPSDGVGNNATALVGGNYIVGSGNWRNGAVTSAGAVTRCGAVGCTGTVTTANSLVGSTMNDFVGSIGFGDTVALPNGNYVVRSFNWDNAGIVDAGAVSYGFGSGSTVGAITFNNSVRGTSAGGGATQRFSFDAVNNQLVVGRPSDNIVTVFRPGAPPTAAAVSVGGRIFKFKGRGIANARVTMTDSNGAIRTALTNPFGYYHFADVAAGETYVFGVKAKRHTFNQATQIHSILEDTNDINFIAD